MAEVEYGYLDLAIDDGYLEGPYLGGEIENFQGFQVNMIASALFENAFQTEMLINSDLAGGQQVQMIASAQLANGFQLLATTFESFEKGMQVNAIAANDISSGMQILADTLRHALCEYYLEHPYLSGPYLATCMKAFEGMQVNLIAANDLIEGMQVSMVITPEIASGFEVEMIVNAEFEKGMQVELLQVFRSGMQATMVIYNAIQIRFMYDFPSRGTSALLGNNWVATSTATGDFLARNVNTDIVEQVWRSSGSPSSQSLTCDTGLPQGVPIDTIAILKHNLTRSATVQVQGSNDNFATPPNITYNMVVETENMYYISPEFPTLLGQNRYWRFIFQDNTNPDGFIEVGTILFGVAEIFSLKDDFINPLRFSYRHFKDVIQTEGFTNISNDRALKKILQLDFQHLNYFSGNYRILKEIMEYARTSLKVLVIPTPQTASRFAVFAKLASMPQITHKGIDSMTEYIDVDLEWDESL